MDYNDIVGKVFKNKEGYKYLIELYRGIIDGKHLYKIVFIEKNTIKTVNRQQAKSGNFASGFRRKNTSASRKKTKAQTPDKKYIYEGKISLGIDGSSTSTGIGVYSENGLIFSTAISPNKSWNLTERCNYIKKELRNIIKEYKPTIVIIEDIYAMNKKVYHALSVIQGIICDLIYEELGLFAKLKTSGQWRKPYGITNKNRQKAKELAISLVKEKYGIDVEDDEAEGALLSEYGYYYES
jgi:Holliday junction resolvasome RuvABC endonuclease subunit